MSDISQITINDTTYDVKDAVARGQGACWYGTSDTEAATATKAVTCTGYTEVAGSILGVFFSTANTAATPTLSVNNGTERSIYVGGGAPNSTSNVLKWSANTMIYFMWDGTYYRYIGATQSSSVISSEGATCWWGTSSTAATSRDKTASITNYKPTKGTLVAIRFSTENTYASNSLRLNINSTNVKTVYNNAGATSASNPLPWAANDTLLFMYDGSYYRYICGSSLYGDLWRDGVGVDVGVSVNTSGSTALLDTKIIDRTVPSGSLYDNEIDSDHITIHAGTGIEFSGSGSSSFTISSTGGSGSMPYCFATKKSYTSTTTSSTPSILPITIGSMQDQPDPMPSPAPNVPWDGHTNDSSAFEDTSDGGIKCKKAGYVSVAGSLYISGSNLQCAAYIFQNSDERFSSGYWSQSGGAQCVRQCQGVLQVAADDVIYIKSRSVSSSNVPANWATYLKIEYLEVTE